MVIDYCSFYSITLVVLIAYLFVGCCCHVTAFMPKGTALNKNSGLPRWKRILYTLVWPAYMTANRVGWEATIFAQIGFLAIIGAIGFDFCQNKLMSLAPTQIKQAVLTADPQLSEVQEDIDDLAGYHLDWENLALASLQNNQKASVLKPAILFAPAAEQVADSIHHPLQARDMIIHYQIKNGLISDNSPPSFSQIHYRKRPLDGYGAAIVAAYLLEHCGYEPYVMHLRTSWQTFFLQPLKSSAYTVYLYKQEGKFGYISLLGISEPKFATLQELAADLSNKMKVKYTQYFIFNLNNTCPGWQTANPGLSGREIWRNL